MHSGCQGMSRLNQFWGGWGGYCTQILTLPVLDPVTGFLHVPRARRVHLNKWSAVEWDVLQANDRTQRMDNFSNSRVSTSFTTLTATQTHSFPSTKRRRLQGRLYGLNSRFDRMLQEVSWASDATKSFPPRYKRAHSPSSSSMTNHDLPKTPTDTPNEIGYARKRRKYFVPATPENRLSATMLRKGASPSQVVKTGNQVNVESRPDLPEWLNNTLATLPTDNAVRFLTLPPERPERPIRKDYIGWSPDALDESPVFAFQAPVDGHHPINPTETERQPGSDLATFRIFHDRSVEFQGSGPVAPPALNVPFSTPGPGWTAPQVSASCSPRRPFSALSMHRPTSTGTKQVRDSPLPFSTPGPFVPARPTDAHVLYCGRATQRSMACDKVLPVAERSGATSVLSFRASRINSLEVPYAHRDGEQFLGSFSLSPKFAFGDVAGPLSSLGTISPTVYVDPPTESPLSSPMLEPASAIPTDRLVVANSLGNLSRGSPTTMRRWSNAIDTTTCGEPAVFPSDIELDRRSIHGVFPLTLSPIASSPDGDTESLPNLKPPATSDSMLLRQFPMTPSPPLLSRCPPTDFDWVSSTHTSDMFGSIEC